MEFISRSILVLTLLLLPPFALPGDVQYVCEVTKVYELNTEGWLEESSWQSVFQNSSFALSRDTGEITGKVLSTVLAQDTTIVVRGSDESSFKALYQFEGQVQLIEIQEFREGSIKPFVALSMGGAGVVTGLCR